ncbi:hypothetical protein [Mycoplasmopsis gallinacea]|uniref:Uncharacterized protein n=1 Tax=Mycoplasmopsis gallinacea TaxID=29556 RepID=A0A6H0V2Y9_9BACT|nr:hypothetical protein [Mycoplasmopsis gallinacea]QIW62348.1 hypothetical protein GOQ20_02850 [Mycoplasmopsis gallinacea]
MNKEKNKKGKKILVGATVGAGVAAAIIIPPLLTKYCNAKSEIKQNKKDIQELNYQIKKTKNELESLKITLGEKDRLIENLNASLKEEKDKLNLARTKLFLLVGSSDENFDFGSSGENALDNSIVKDLHKNVARLTNDVRSKEARIASLEKELENLKSDYQVLQTKLKQKEKENVDLLNQIEAIIADNKQKIALLNLEIANLQGENEEKDRIIVEKEQEINQLNANIENLNALITEQEATIREKNANIATLTNERDANKQAFLNSIIEYRQTIKNLVNELGKIKQANKEFVQSLFANYNDNLDTNDASLAEIAKYTIGENGYDTLLANGELTVFDGKVITLSERYKDFNEIDENLQSSFNDYLNLDDEQYKAFLFDENNVKNDAFLAQLQILNLLKEKTNSNFNVLNEAFAKMLELNKERNQKTTEYLNSLITQIETLTGEKYNPTKDFGNNGENANGGVIQRLKDKITNLENVVSKAKSKLTEYVGSEDENFDAGENGENSLENSLVYRLRKEIEQKQNTLEEKDREIQTKNSEIENKTEQIQRLEQEKTDLNSTIESQKEQIKQLENTKAEQTRKIGELENRKTELERENAQKDESIRSLTQAKEAALAEVEEWKRKYNSANSELQSTNRTLSTAKNKLYSLTGSSDPNFNVGTNGENAKSGSLIYRLRQQISEKEARISTLNKQVGDKEKQNDEIIAMWNALNVKKIIFTRNIYEAAGFFYLKGFAWNQLQNMFIEKFEKLKKDPMSLDTNFLAFDEKDIKGSSQSKYGRNSLGAHQRFEWKNLITNFENIVLKSNDFLISAKNFETWKSKNENRESGYRGIENPFIAKETNFTIYEDLNNPLRIELNGHLHNKKFNTYVDSIDEYKEYVEDKFEKWKKDQFNGYRYVEITQTKVRQLVGIKGAELIFRESEIEIEWEPTIQVVDKKIGSRRELSFSLFWKPVVIKNYAYNDILQTYKLEKSHANLMRVTFLCPLCKIIMLNRKDTFYYMKKLIDLSKQNIICVKNNAENFRHFIIKESDDEIKRLHSNVSSKGCLEINKYLYS